jgi:hypothetical protein
MPLRRSPTVATPTYCIGSATDTSLAFYVCLTGDTVYGATVFVVLLPGYLGYLCWPNAYLNNNR